MSVHPEITINVRSTTLPYLNHLLEHWDWWFRDLVERGDIDVVARAVRYMRSRILGQWLDRFLN